MAEEKKKTTNGAYKTSWLGTLSPYHETDCYSKTPTKYPSFYIFLFTYSFNVNKTSTKDS